MSLDYSAYNVIGSIPCEKGSKLGNKSNYNNVILIIPFSALETLEGITV